MFVLVTAAAAVVVVIAAFALDVWLRWRRSEVQPSVTEADARENAAPLTTAILSRSPNRKQPPLDD